MELGPFTSPQGGKDWSATSAHAAPKETKQQWKLRYRECLYVMDWSWWNPSLHFLIICYHLLLFPLFIRRLSVVWLAGPWSFPASQRGPPPPLLLTLVTTTPPTPPVAPMEWQGSTGTLTIVQVHTNTNRLQSKTQPLSASIKSKYEILTKILSFLWLPPSTRGQCGQCSLPDSSPKEESSWPYRCEGSSSRETAQPVTEPTPAASPSTWPATAWYQPPWHPNSYKPGRLRHPLKKGLCCVSWLISLWQVCGNTCYWSGVTVFLCYFVEDGVEEETSVREFLHLQEHVPHLNPVSFPNAKGSYWAGRLPVLSLFPSSLQEQWRLQQWDHHWWR